MYKSRNSFSSSLMVEALLLLLENKEYDSITVKEICEKAGVNRSTFYMHYDTKDDLLVGTMKYINARLSSDSNYDAIIPRSNDEKEFAFAYFNYGVLAIIDKWVESDCEEDVYKIADLIIKLISL